MYILFAKHVMSVYVTVMVSLVGYWLWRYLSAIDIAVVAVATCVATSWRRRCTSASSSSSCTSSTTRSTSSRRSRSKSHARVTMSRTFSTNSSSRSVAATLTVLKRFMCVLGLSRTRSLFDVIVDVTTMCQFCFPVVCNF